jgi:GT2 family glycosyltransferase
MTFRRSVCETLRFEELLRHSASYGEDHDFCYRASRVGAVVQLPEARLHHAVAPQGRASERTVITMLWCNRIALQACNGSYRARAVRRLVIALPLHFTILMLRDVVNGDLGLPRTRGLFVAIPQCLRLLFLSKDRVRQTYPSIQARLFGSKSQARS